MTLSTVGIAVHETPPVIGTFLRHVGRPHLTKRSKKRIAEQHEADPAAALTYDEGACRTPAENRELTGS